MKRALTALSLCCLAVLFTTPAMAEGNINFAIGQRSFDSNDYGPVDEQTFFGATADFKKDWPVDLAAGLYFSSKSDEVAGIEVSASVIEATFGVMKTWEVNSIMHPFVGGGVGIVKAEAEIDDGFFGVQADDTAPAFYAEGGIYWTLNRTFNLGVSGRYMNAMGIEFEGEEFDTKYLQIGVLAGFAWGQK
ncbi:MAG: hypothetical protein ACREAA_19645 [Candidatus Polarisedimenticolia bacterium]